MYKISFSRLLESGYSDQAFFEPLRYITLPLINLEFIANKISLLGDTFSPNRLFDLMMPAKIAGEDRGFLLADLPEPSSPSGFYSQALVHAGGIFGVALYSFIIGAFCKKIFNIIFINPFYFIFYGFISWSIITSHSYNHFLTITFIPLQFIICLFLSNIFIKEK
jgi:hypothetical protein